MRTAWLVARSTLPRPDSSLDRKRSLLFGGFVSLQEAKLKRESARSRHLNMIKGKMEHLGSITTVLLRKCSAGSGTQLSFCRALGRILAPKALHILIMLEMVCVLGIGMQQELDDGW